MSGKKLNSDFSDAEPPASEGASVAARAGAPKRTTANRAARESRRAEELRRRGNEQASKAGVNVSKGASKREPLPFQLPCPRPVLCKAAKRERSARRTAAALVSGREHLPCETGQTRPQGNT